MSDNTDMSNFTLGQQHFASPLLERLQKVRSTGSNKWVARCPAHQDSDPSLSIKLLSDGRTLIHCHAECAPLDVLTAVGLGWEALHPPRDNYRAICQEHNVKPRTPLTATVDDYKVAIGKQLSRQGELSDSDRLEMKKAILRGGEDNNLLQQLYAPILGDN
jgi:hypothetical protein